MGIQDGGVDMSNEINENLANERLEESCNLRAACRGSNGNADVEIVLSLDGAANCGLARPQDIRDSK